MGVEAEGEGVWAGGGGGGGGGGVLAGAARKTFS